MKNKDLIIVIIFILFLVGPNIIYWFVKDKMDNNNYENRKLYEKPEFEFKDIANFPNNYENYFNDHIAFKNEMRKARSNALYKIFNISSNNRVIIGKDGWLFYNGAAAGDADTISDFRNINLYSTKDSERIKNMLLLTRDKLKDKNIDFYIFIIPNKENVYSDYMPSIINRKHAGGSKTEVLINYLKENTDLNIIYPKQTLVDNLKNYNTYYKYDTHWNNYGAYLGVKDLMEKIDSDFDMQNIEVKMLTHNGGDLASMNLMSVSNEEPSVYNFYNDVKYECKTIDKIEKCTSNGLKNEKIMFIGDSFRTASKQYISKIYKNSIFMHVNNYNTDFIEKYDPDIIVYEAVERFSYLLATSYQLVK